MRLIQNFSSLLAALFMLTHCCVKQADNHIEQFSFPTATSKPANPFIGKWECTNIMLYSSELTLADDGTFMFHDQSCLCHEFSKGQWTTDNGKIMLTSFDSFKEHTHIQIKSIELLKKKKTRNKRKLQLDLTSLSYATDVHFPGPNDTVKVYLHNIQLELKNDTLYSTGQNKVL